MTWRCARCKSNNVRFRSRARDYRCSKCGHLFSTAPVSEKIYNHPGNLPKFLKVRS